MIFVNEQAKLKTSKSARRDLATSALDGFVRFSIFQNCLIFCNED